MRFTATGRALLAEGEAIGMARAEAWGRLVGLRRTIAIVVETRLGSLPAWVRARLDLEDDIERLERLLLATVDANTEADLRRSFRF